jgi:hypothetical protein
MAQVQTQNTPTNEAATKPTTSFDSISLEHLEQTFNETYKVSKGSASQVVLGFKHMISRLQNPTNEYQQTIYPTLKQFCERVVSSYESTFLSNRTSPVERQVFGANLNGNRNNGSLYRSIPSGVNRNLTYNYAQFGQLLRVLTGRLQFVVNRDASKVQRYNDNQEERTAYQTLQTVTTGYLQTLTQLGTEWNTLVTSTRQQFGVETQPRQPRQPRQSRQQHSHQPRQYEQRNTSQSQNQSTRQERPHRSNQSRSTGNGNSNGEWQTVVRRRPQTQRTSRSTPQSTVTA